MKNQIYSKRLKRTWKKLSSIAKAKLTDPAIGICLVAGFVLGFIAACCLISFCCIKIDPTLSFGNLFQAIMTMASAVFIWLFLKRFVDSEQQEKLLFAQQLELLNGLLDDFENVLGGATYTGVAAAVKNVNIKVNFLKQVASDYGFCDELCSKISELSKQIQELRTLATELGTQNSSIVVVDDRVDWDDELKIEIGCHVESIKRAIFHIAMESNRKL